MGAAGWPGIVVEEPDVVPPEVTPPDVAAGGSLLMNTTGSAGSLLTNTRDGGIAEIVETGSTVAPTLSEFCPSLVSQDAISEDSVASVMAGPIDTFP
jgi:hypothetical protein